MFTGNNNDRFLQEVYDAFGQVKIFSSLGDRSPHLLTYHYEKSDAPHRARVLPRLYPLIDEFPPDEDLYSYYAKRKDLILFGDGEYSEGECTESGLVIVNLAIPFSDAVHLYPHSVVAGYAHTGDELVHFKSASDIENPFFFSYGRDQPNVLRFVYGKSAWYLYGSRFEGVLTEEDFGPVILERIRQELLTRSLAGCTLCAPVRQYYDTQQFLLREGRSIGEIFRFSPLAKLDEAELPVMGKPGRCGRYHPRTQEFIGRGNNHCGGAESTDQSARVLREFAEKYLALIECLGTG